MYNFDEIIDRKNTNSLKYDFAKERNMPEDVLPLWVADMDFRCPQEVLDALTKASSHGIFGYSDAKEEYFEAVHNWYKHYFGWSIQKEWLVKTPGIVFAIATSIKAYTKENDAILIQKPVYYPFSMCIENNNRKIINSPLVYKDNKYSIDFEDFENKIITNNVKLFILCNPHNPVGRVWTKDELIKIGTICLNHNVKIISDEIHADFVYPGYKHINIANLKPEFSDITVTCTAPSKTFNIAGLQISNIIIKNQKLRDLYTKEMLKCGYSQVNALGIIAAQAAFKYGREWLNDLKNYLIENINFTRDFLNKNLPQITLVEPESTFLLWLDFTKLNLTDKEIDDLIINKAKLWLDTGTMFGEEGSGFQRINIACPRSVLQQALESLKSAISSI